MQAHHAPVFFAVQSKDHYPASLLTPPPPRNPVAPETAEVPPSSFSSDSYRNQFQVQLRLNLPRPF